MDALQFLQEYHNICMHHYCDQCPLSGYEDAFCKETVPEFQDSGMYKDIVSLVKAYREKRLKESRTY